MAIAFAAYLLLTVAGGFAIDGFLGPAGSSAARTLAFAALSGSAVILVVGSMSVLGRGNLGPSSVGLRPVSAPWLVAGAGAGLLCWLTSFLVVLSYAWATGGGGVGTGTDLGPADFRAPHRFALALLVGGALAPLAEEVLFRGLLFAWLRPRGLALAVVSSTLVFGLFHGAGGFFPDAAVVGVTAALLYERSGSLWPAVAAHAANNAVGYSLAWLLA